MRLKKPTLCDPDVRQYSGYLDMDDKHIFFWYFGSRKRLSSSFNATTDKVPLVFWFSGGPGCSSQIANWQENGPCSYVPSSAFDRGMSDEMRKLLPHEIRRNPNAWNNVADIVFIDQPVGTGFSHGRIPNSTEGAADTAWRVMQGIYALLLSDAKKKKEHDITDVHIFGESYAGRYIPVFAEYLLHMNKHVLASSELRDRGFLELPLQGIGIGNGMFDYSVQTPSYYTIGCNSTYPALFNRPQCAYLKSRLIPGCSDLITKCYSAGAPQSSALGMRADDCVRLRPERWRTSKECAAADSYCSGALNWTTMVSTYDIRPNAHLVPDDYVDYLRSEEFMKAVGVDEDIDYVECSDAVFDRFSATSDGISRSAMSSLQFVLGKNIQVLLYSGDADFICNWYGTLAVAKALEWQGKARFAEAKPTNWSWPATTGSNIEAGQFKSVDNLTFLRVYQAGHEVPYYQPQASLYMLSQFLKNNKLS
ncbi:hypothetical protein GGI24_001448 [Coemansia furcata]|nr:hypothetical protein GGI24_001448 [Coemansia furcata]